MADPLSITASVFAVATAAIQLSTTVYDFISKVRNAPREMRHVASSMLMLGDIMNAIAGVLEKGGDVFQKRLVDRVKAILSMFENVHEEVMQIVASRRTSKARMVYSWILWPLEARNLAELLGRVEALKTSTQLVLHTIGLAIMQNEPEKEARSLLMLRSAIRENIQVILDIQEYQPRTSAIGPANGSHGRSPYGVHAPPHAALPSTATHARPSHGSLALQPFRSYGSPPFNSFSNPNGPFELDTATQPRKSDVISKPTTPDSPSHHSVRRPLTSRTTDDLPYARRSMAFNFDLDAQISGPTKSYFEVDRDQQLAKPSIRSRSLPRKPKEQSVALPMEKGPKNTLAPPDNTAPWLFRFAFEPKMEIGADTKSGGDCENKAPSNDGMSQSGHTRRSKDPKPKNFTFQQLNLASRIPLAPPAIIFEKLLRIEIPSAISDLLSEWTNLDREEIALIAFKSRVEEKVQDDLWEDYLETDNSVSAASDDSWPKIRDKYASAEPAVDKQVLAYPGYPGYPGYPQGPALPSVRDISKEGGDAMDTSLVSKDVTGIKGSSTALPGDVAASLKGDKEEAMEAESIEQKLKDRIAELEALGEKLKATRQAESEERQAELKATREFANLKAEAAAEERENNRKMIEELRKKLAEVEATKVKSEEKSKRYNLIDDSLIGPIRFTDAVGRKFILPWHICKTWNGMESSILEAFLHIETLGPHVSKGHYDLVGPDGEIILPRLWDSSVKPNCSIIMKLWPMEAEEGAPPPPHPPDDNASTRAMSPGGKGTDTNKKGKKPAGSPSAPSPPPSPPEIISLPAELGPLPVPRPPGYPDFPPPPKSLPLGASPRRLAKAARRRRIVVRRTGRDKGERRKNGSVRTADSSLRTVDSVNDEELLRESKSGVRGWLSNWGTKSLTSAHQKKLDISPLERAGDLRILHGLNIDVLAAT